MNIQIVDTEEGFDSLEAAWNDLADRTKASFFSSFDYLRTAWRHFHRKEDRLLILLFAEAETIRAIAPFYITHRPIKGIPSRIIRFIAAWEGDRPQLLNSRGAEETWGALLKFLEKEFTGWDLLDLVEQPAEGPAGSGWSFLPRSGWYWESQPDAMDYYISLGGSWDEFLSSLSPNTRKNWRRQTRRLSTFPGGYNVERIFRPSEVREALIRFIAIEQSGWKAGAKIGVAKDELHQIFYEDLVNHLAEKEQVMFHFLKIDHEDAAGIVSFMRRDVICARHTAYLPAYASYSPGILILVEIMREGFMGPWRELDLLGIEEDGNSSNYKNHWATGTRETIHWAGYRFRSRLLPLIAIKRFKSLFAGQGRSTMKGIGVPSAIAGDGRDGSESVDSAPQLQRD
jgi:CelD/BcsL family acetyltransferase involved in cellulose biosynthesis